MKNIGTVTQRGNGDLDVNVDSTAIGKLHKEHAAMRSRYDAVMQGVDKDDADAVSERFISALFKGEF